MSKYHWKTQFRSTRSIVRDHGLITWLLYWLTGLLSLATVSHWARWPPDELPVIGHTHDEETAKTKPWIQDLVVLILVLLTPLTIWLAWGDNQIAFIIGLGFSAYLIFDALSRHIRIIWFDDLEPSAPKKRRKVTSHRRILFLALLSYAQSLFLFPALLHSASNFKNVAYGELLGRSFNTATLLSFPHMPIWVDYAEVIISIFYLAIVVATTASIAYQRDEVEREN